MDLALGRVAGHIKQLNLVHDLELLVVGKLPHDFLVTSDLEDVRLLAQMASKTSL